MDYFKNILDRRHNSFKVNSMIRNTNYVDDNKTLAFTVADMDFDIMPEVKEAINKYMKTNCFGYTFEDEAYYDAVTNFFKAVHNFDVNRQEVLTFTGVMPMIETIIRSFTKENDGIIIFTPVYTPFFLTINNNNRQIVECPLNNNNGDYSIDYDLFEKLASETNTKMVLFCSPHNPVSRVWTKEELEKVANIALENDLLIISDEIHCDITLFDHQHVPMASISREVADITFMCTSPSKTFNLASLNVANLIVKNPKLYGSIVNYKMKQAHNNVNALGLVACKAAYLNHHEYLKQLKSLIETNYHLLKTKLSQQDKIKITDLQGTYLMWCDFSRIDSEHLEETLNKNNIFLNNGKIYGKEGQGYYRINIACPTKYIEVLADRLLEVVETL